MEILLFGIWDIPVSNYWFFYGFFGVVGFLLCYFNRYLVVLVVPIIVWFAVSDVQHFYHSINVRPEDSYIFSAVLAMVLAFVLTILGLVVNIRKTKHLR